MAKRAPPLDVINRRLERIVAALSNAANDIRDAKLGPGRNVYRVGQALMAIFEIQADIYRNRPDLLPRLLHGTRLAEEVLSNRTVEKDGRRKRPRASHRKR
jgi:hypothetical protein